MASDHAGFDLKADLLAFVSGLGWEIEDLGVHGRAPSDYPDSAEAVGLALLNGRADRGILICGSGVGVSVAANKIPGIRAGICHDYYSAHQGVEHDDMNVLVLGSRIVSVELAKDLVRAFLDARFTREERHVRRLAKVAALERKYCRALTESETPAAV
ncbi:MAG TPA: ribose 5-phosphate isomerase B [Bryobacteraceae bacterium]|nr:ribose 5-phosphate isomerase B [Bryobacteraceae bacterium]